MMYPLFTLDDHTEIVHSEMLPNQRVRVYLEKPDEKGGFHSASCYLPIITGRIFPASRPMKSPAIRKSSNLPRT